MTQEEYDVIVIGSGPGGYVSAIRCAQLGMKTACVEKGPLGGTCLNIGCIPSKTLLHSSELFYSLSHHMPEHGIKIEKAGYDFPAMMSRKQKVVEDFNQGVAFLFKKNKITHLKGTATLISKNTVSVDGKEVGAKSIIIATGSEPIQLPFLPVDEKRVVTSEGALSLEKVPKKMIVIGAGVIGVELGSVYNRLGAEVIFIEFLPKICPTMDDDISKAFQKILEKQGLIFHLNSKVTAADVDSDTITLSVGEEKYEADVVLCSIGRRAYTDNLGLEKVGIEVTKQGMIPINGRFQTKIPNIYAIGDVVEGPMLAHKASEEGIAVAELLAGEKPTIDYLAIPNVIYTDPEVAAVGLTEQEAKKFDREIKVGSFPFSINSRAKCTGQTEGLVKIVSDGKTDILLGIHIVGSNASEMIAEGVLAIEEGITTLELANTSHAHPTLSEAIKEAALAALGRPIHR